MLTIVKKSSKTVDQTGCGLLITQEKSSEKISISTKKDQSGIFELMNLNFVYLSASCGFEERNGLGYQ